VGTEVSCIPKARRFAPTNSIVIAGI
jgi:hypothetical protein